MSERMFPLRESEVRKLLTIIGKDIQCDDCPLEKRESGECESNDAMGPYLCNDGGVDKMDTETVFRLLRKILGKPSIITRIEAIKTEIAVLDTAEFAKLDFLDSKQWCKGSCPPYIFRLDNYQKCIECKKKWLEEEDENYA